MSIILLAFWMTRMTRKMNLNQVYLINFRVSQHATAAIASSVLQDIGQITDTDYSHAIDKCKIRRGKCHCTPNEKICGLYFDGRKDDTLYVEKVNAKHFRRNRIEEHYSLIQEPGSTYIRHVSPFSGSSTDIT
ncbi:hypothetical protein PR048_008053 [Dryococelus australis]|uniref:Uncharacterized protein n=1 Tax=Dryococelus australis TaxID=614101 RepID=A0ABQ9HWB4_9NEOP|nr:hypothetical protein PR048_008053 [Dryococelus australis]